MKKKKKTPKKQRKLLTILLIILGIEIILVTHKILVKYVLVDNKNSDIPEIQEEKINNDLYDYKISNRATDYEKQLFNQLEEIISKELISYEEYGKVLTQIFITDLFTLKNKKSSNDIRSSQYIYKDYQETFKLMVKESLYSNIELDLDRTREQQLPEVTEVTINSITKDIFKYNNEILDNEALFIEATINYELDLGYPTNYKVVLVKKDNLLQVVKASQKKLVNCQIVCVDTK